MKNRKRGISADIDLEAFGVFGKKKQVAAKAKVKEKPAKRTGDDDKIADALTAWKAGTALAKLAGDLGMRRKQLKRAFVKLLGGKDKFTEARAAGAGGRGDFGGKRGGGRQAAPPVDDSKVKVLRADKLKWRKSDFIIDYAKQQCVALVQKLKEFDTTRAKHYRRSLERELEEMRAIAKSKKDDRWHYRQEPEHEPKPRKVEVKEKGKTVGHSTIMDTGTPIPVYISPKGNEYVRAKDTEPADLILESDRLGTRVRLIRWQKSSMYRKSSKAIEQHEKDLERGQAALDRKAQRRAERKAAKEKADRKAKRGKSRRRKS